MSSSGTGEGILLVLAGPSGVGKGTIGRQLLEQDPSLAWSVSATTRDPRPGEVDGVDYRFLTRDEFEALRDAGGFLEWFEVYGQLKGTPREQVDARLRAGRDVLMEVDVQGAMAIRAVKPDALLVFLRAPSREVQLERLRGGHPTTTSRWPAGSPRPRPRRPSRTGSTPS